MTVGIFSIWYYCAVTFVISALEWVFGGMSVNTAVAMAFGALFLALTLTFETWLEHRKPAKKRKA